MSAPPTRMTVRGLTYCCALPATMLATAPAPRRAVNDRAMSAVDQPAPSASGFWNTLQA